MFRAEHFLGSVIGKTKNPYNPLMSVYETTIDYHPLILSHPTD